VIKPSATAGPPVILTRSRSHRARIDRLAKTSTPADLIDGDVGRSTS
jgi:hypothetical protein